MDTILVTGGAGYIGSHVVRELARSGYRPVILDHLGEGHREAVVAGDFVLGNLSDESVLDSLFSQHAIDGVMHFASRCYVGESVENPQLYYEENVLAALTLFRVMKRHGVRRFVLSSSCAVYGNPQRIPIDEDHPKDPVNPYGETKYFVERILSDYDRAYGFPFVALRYFNAAGASLDGKIGESHDPETHLIPLVLQVAKGEAAEVTVFGDDYATRDGTCVRDYVHVLDLAAAHIAAYQWLKQGKASDSFNLGTGSGYTVREVVSAAERVTGRTLARRVAERRSGDPPELVADSSKAASLLEWTPRYSELETIVETAWSWEQKRTY